jgi:hypothetical protein
MLNFLPPIWAVLFQLVIGTLSPTSDSSTSTIQSIPASLTPAIISSDQSTDQLAKCLTTKGAIMYGAYWCSHCSDQKTTFGSAFQYVKYIECDPKGEKANSQACQKAQIKNYPTWVMPGHDSLEGTQSLSDLASWSKCSF